MDGSRTMPEKTSELESLLETWSEETDAFFPTESNPLYGKGQKGVEGFSVTPRHPFPLRPKRSHS